MGTSPPPLTIDVVDDDRDVLGSLRFLLESEGFQVRTFTSGSDLLKCPPVALPDCLIIDYKMDGMNGLDLFQRLRMLGRVSPVVLITGYPDETISTKAAAAGIRHVVLKPHVEESLIMHVRSAMAETGPTIEKGYLRTSTKSS
jgi:two-component system, LuxR family, response regulator FixJ